MTVARLLVQCNEITQALNLRRMFRYSISVCERKHSESCHVLFRSALIRNHAIVAET